MRNNLIIAGVLVAVLGFAFLAWYVVENSEEGSLTQAQAVATVKQAYPELADYPSDQLPPRSVAAEAEGGNWYVAFIQEGSGRPILGARCFLVEAGGVVWERSYTPDLNDTGLHFSAKTCSSGTSTTGNTNANGSTNAAGNSNGNTCGIENCHGLEITCGSNPAQMCTAMYALGDRCRSLASCAVVGGTCQLISSDEFVSCRSCVESCLEDYPEDAERQFLCEADC